MIFLNCSNSSRHCLALLTNASTLGSFFSSLAFMIIGKPACSGNSVMCKHTDKKAQRNQNNQTKGNDSKTPLAGGCGENMIRNQRGVCKRGSHAFEGSL